MEMAGVAEQDPHGEGVESGVRGGQRQSGRVREQPVVGKPEPEAGRQHKRRGRGNGGERVIAPTAAPEADHEEYH